MTIDDIVETLKIAAAEVEWNYPLNYAEALEEAAKELSTRRWIWANDGYLRCSNCHQKAPVMTQYQDEPMTVATDYCPNCGCRMDLEGE